MYFTANLHEIFTKVSRNSLTGHGNYLILKASKQKTKNIFKYNFTREA
jgi:hypothetical protein